MNQENKWGGKREGSGRPKSEIERKYKTIWVSDEEHEKVKQLLAELRS